MDLRAIIVFSCQARFDTNTLTQIVAACLPRWGVAGVTAQLQGNGDQLKLCGYQTHVLSAAIASGAFDRLQTASGGTMTEFVPLLQPYLPPSWFDAFASAQVVRSRSTSLTVGNTNVLCVALGAK